MTDVCIVGIGIHPFGRTEGRSGLEALEREAVEEQNGVQHQELLG